MYLPSISASVKITQLLPQTLTLPAGAWGSPAHQNPPTQLSAPREAFGHGSSHITFDYGFWPGFSSNTLDLTTRNINEDSRPDILFLQLDYAHLEDKNQS